MACIDMACIVMAYIGMVYIVMAYIVMAQVSLQLYEPSSLERRIELSDSPWSAVFFSSISEHADGERRGLVSMWAVPEGAEAFPAATLRFRRRPLRRSPSACSEGR